MLTVLAKLFTRALICVCLLFTCGQVTAEPLTQVKVVEPFIEMHSGPAIGYPVVHVAAKGEWINVIKRRTNWFKVETDRGVIGWVKYAALTQTHSANGEEVSLTGGSFDTFSERDFEFGALAGVFGGIPALTLFADWVATDNIIAGLSVSQALGDLSENHYFLASIQHTAFPDWRIAPYFTLGAGQIRTQPRTNLVQSGDESRTSDLLAAGVGVRYYLAQNFLLKLEYKNFLVLTNRDENEEVEQWKLGFAVYF